MLPLKYIKNSLIYLLKYNNSNDMMFIRNIYSLVKNEYIDESNPMGNVLILLVKELMDGKNIHQAIASVVSVDLSADTIIETLKNEILTEEDIIQLKHVVSETLSIINIMGNVKKIQQISSKILNREIKSSTEIKANFESIMNTLIDTLVKLDKNVEQDSLEISADTIDKIINRIQNYYEQERLILYTGLELLDKYLNGGLHSSRLYTFAMKSGDGKSTVMMALARRILDELKPGTRIYEMILEKIKKEYITIEGKPTVYYFTFENSIDESLERFLPGLIGKPINSINDIQANLDIIKEKLSSYGAIFSMEYRGGFTTSPIDIIQHIEREKIKGKYPVAIFVDYLGIMVSDSGRTEKRLQLEEITAGLKNIAVLYNVPVITGVQVKKDSFDKGELSLSDIKESSGIIDNSDVVLAAWQGDTLNLSNSSQRELFVKIEKQRNYIKGVKVKLGVDFSTYSLFNVTDQQGNQNINTTNNIPTNISNDMSGFSSIL